MTSFVYRRGRNSIATLIACGLTCLTMVEPAQSKPKHPAERPSWHTAQLADVEAYRAWKAQYLKQGPCAADERYIDSSGDAGEPGDITVSEGHGFGMLALVAMADVDPEAHQDFDAMVNLMRRHEVSATLPLMAWRLTAECRSGVPAPSAPDGDIDMAYALLLADARWGAEGSHAYRDLAIQRITALMEPVGDPYMGGTRLSDYIMPSFKAFAAATSDHRWLQLVAHGYSMMTQLQREYGHGLLPDFVIVKDGKATPAPPKYLEGELDGGYGYNACRLPWRLATDVALYHDPRGQAVLAKLVTALLQASGGNPHKLMDGYSLDGTAVGPRADRFAFVAPAAAGLCALPNHHSDGVKWMQEIARTPIEGQKYYSDTLRIMSSLPQLPML